MSTRKPHALLDAVSSELGVSTDYTLSEQLGVGQPALSKIRNNRSHTVSARIKLAIHEATAWTFKKIKELEEAKS